VLLALAERGLVLRREPDLRYSIGPACIGIGDAARSSLSILAAVAPIADELARSTHACAALATGSGTEIRVADVFDHSPAFGLTTRVGQAIPLMPPFGAVFVAWDTERGVERWLDQAESELSSDERQRYLSALETIRERGYSVTVSTVVRPDLADTLNELVDNPRAEKTLHRRDQLIRQMVHSEYLPTAIEADVPVRVVQMSAPVFDHLGELAVVIMVLGPNYDMTATEIAGLGDRLLIAARTATQRVGGRRRPAAG
jgi:DNA-binding IclR family transcriptional regulator